MKKKWHGWYKVFVYFPQKVFKSNKYIVIKFNKEYNDNTTFQRSS